MSKLQVQDSDSVILYDFRTGLEISNPTRNVAEAEETQGKRVLWVREPIPGLPFGDGDASRGLPYDSLPEPKEVPGVAKSMVSFCALLAMESALRDIDLSRSREIVITWYAPPSHRQHFAIHHHRAHRHRTHHRRYRRHHRHRHHWTTGPP